MTSSIEPSALVGNLPGERAWPIPGLGDRKETGMAYRIRYHRAARLELDKCKETYKPTPLPRRLDRWLGELAEEAESSHWSLSIDLEAFLENAEQAEQLVRHWPDIWQRFWKASPREKLKACLFVLRKWRPPYQARASLRAFTLYAQQCEVHALYLVDHAAKEVVFMAFDGLPMQGYD
jgi:hypothetical protein